MRLASKIVLWATTALLALGFIAASATPSFATGVGNQWDYRNAWINAWNGGPFVKVYSSGGVANNDFQLINNAGGWELEFQNSGYCVGDAYNDQNNDATSLNSCGGVYGGSAGWGTLFDVSQPCGKGSYAFRNRHWSSLTGTNAYLGPPNGWVNGSEFYLNNENLADCFAFFAPA
jgi:hypothetical protein